MIELVIAGALLLHGLGHGGAVGALMWTRLRPGTDTRGWMAARRGFSNCVDVGIVLFFGTWPMFNTLAATGMNVAVLVALLWLHWPPQSLFGK